MKDNPKSRAPILNRSCVRLGKGLYKPNGDWLFYSLRLPEGARMPKSASSAFAIQTYCENPFEMGCVMVNDGDTVKVYPQLATLRSDSVRITSSVLAAYGIRPIESDDIFSFVLTDLFKHKPRFKDFNLWMQDYVCFENCMPSTRNDLMVASHLKEGEGFVRSLLVSRNDEEPFDIALRYLAWTRKDRKDAVFDALIKSTSASGRVVYSETEYARRGISKENILRMFLRRETHHRGVQMLPKEATALFVIPWSAQSQHDMGFEVSVIESPKPPRELLNSNGVCIGQELNRGLPVYLPLKHSVLILGTTGLGKSVLMSHIARQHFEKPDSMSVVFEQKDVNFIRELMGLVPDDRIDDVVNIDPRIPLSYNIAQPLSELVNTLWTSYESTHGMGLGATIRLVIEFAILALAKWNDEVTMVHLYSFYTDKVFQKKVLSLNADPKVHAFVKNVLPKIQFSSIIGLLNKIMMYTKNPLISSCCQSENTISFTDFLSSQKLVFANLAGLQPEIISDIGNSILSRLVQAMYQYGYECLYKNGKACYVLIDEFYTWSSLSSISAIMGQGRGMGVHGVLSLHSLFGQLSPDALSSVLANSPVRVVFRSRDKDALLMGKEMGLNPESIKSLNAYEAFVQLDNLPVIKIKTLPPVKSDEARSQRCLVRSKEQFGAKKLESIDPFGLFGDEEKKADFDDGFDAL